MQRILAAMLLAVALVPCPGLAQFPLGSEFQVNQHTTSAQEFPSVAAAADGSFVVVWDGFDQDGDGFGIFGRRYDPEGGALGAEFAVNSTTSGSQEQPAVASDPAGNFVVVWEGSADGIDKDIYARRFDGSGAALGSDFRVNSFTTSSQAAPAVAAAPDGSFVAVWQSSQGAEGNNVVGQRFTNSGNAIGAEFQVNTTASGEQTSPAVAADSTGDFIVAWQSPDGNGSGVFAQRFGSAGEVLGTEFRVNQFTTANQGLPSVASDTDGNFVIAWEGGGAQDGDGFGVFARRYDSTGAALGDEFQVNTYTTGDQAPPPRVARLEGTSRFLPGDVVDAIQLAQESSTGTTGRGSSGSRSSGGSSGAPALVVAPSVASDANGDFAIVWSSEAQDGSLVGVYGQRFDQSGAPSASEFQVNTYTTGDQSNPVVASDADGNFIVAWDSIGQDGDDAGVFAQRYADTLCGNGTVDGGEVCDAGAANGSTSSCCTTECTARSAGSTCRASADVCDAAETCDGSSGTCPVDGFASAETVCRSQNGDCDEAETCTGSSSVCPADGFASAETVCRASEGICDVAETCTGSSNTCPTDGFADAATVCRSADGVCDVAETCTGSSNTCPTDGFADGATVCRSADGVCDVAETCTGSSGTCPTDGFAGASTVCRGAADVCDVAETCSGSSGACPTDAFASAATVCRASAGVCDVADSCTGSSAACPADAKSTAECRATTGECDAAETCDGTNDACPADGVAPAGTPCGGDASACTDDVCDGSSAVCTHPPVQPTNDCIVNGHHHKPCVATSSSLNSIIGTHGDDVIVGGGGSDFLYGLAGDDLICGGNGNDTIDGGIGGDTLLGGNGFDTLIGSFGDDVCKDGEINILCDSF